ncbi:MAG: sigma 54-interacting transcriptional regulator, partial [Desulfovibrionales bacterium]
MISKVFGQYELIKDTFEQFCDFVCRFDTQGRITYVNKELAELLDMEPQSFTNKPIYSFLQSHDQKKVVQAVASLKEEKPLTTVITDLELPCGETRQVHWVGQVLMERSGTIREYLALGREFDFDWEVNAILEKNRERLQLALESTRMGIFDWDIPGNQIFVNREWIEYLGFDWKVFPLELDDWVEMNHPEDRHEILRQKTLLLSGHSDSLHFESRRKAGTNGDWMWVLTRGKVTARDSSGAPLRVTGTSMDVTKRINVSRALRKKGRMLTEILDSIASHIAVLDSRGVILNTNRAWDRFALENGGLVSQIGPGANYLSVCARSARECEEAAQAAAGISEVLQRRRSSFRMEYPCHADGREQWFLMQVSPFSGNEGMLGAVVTHVDITDRKKAEQELVEKNELHLRLFEENHAAILLIDPETMRIVDANQSACMFYGVSKEELKRRKISDFDTLSPEEITKNIHWALQGPKSFQLKLSVASGEIREVHSYAGPIQISNRTLLLFVIHDVTEQKLNERKLQKTTREREKYRSNLEAVFSSILDPILTIDTDFSIIRQNEAVQRMFPCFKELQGQDLRDVFPAPDCQVRDIVDKVLRSRQPIRECHVQCDSGKCTTCCISPVQTRDLVVNCTPLVQGGSFHGTVLVLRDVSRQAELERAVVKKHSFGRLVGRSRKMKELFALLEHMGEIETTVLLTGESGTGKELVSEALHDQGGAYRPFVRVNCSALSEHLLESELFGHVRGAFTGATKDRIGRFEAADGGTILLDEIGEIPPFLQVKLLRFLESKEFERVGESRTRRSNAR